MSGTPSPYSTTPYPAPVRASTTEDEARMARERLQEEIALLISRFEQRTGVRVEAVEVGALGEASEGTGAPSAVRVVVGS